MMVLHLKIYINYNELKKKGIKKGKLHLHYTF